MTQERAAALTEIMRRALVDDRVDSWIVRSDEYGIEFTARKRVPDARRGVKAGRIVSYLELEEAHSAGFILGSALEEILMLIDAEANK